MKKLFLILILAIVAVSCKKDKQVGTINNNTIIGKWDLVLVTGGIANIHETAAQSGHHASVTFKPDQSCVFTYDTNITTHKTYTLVPNNISHQLNDLYIDGVYGLTLSYVNDTLGMSNKNISDATADWYVKE
jgi:hypothetical protein